jgi:NAD(P) transhydrogenase subunit beta
VALAAGTRSSFEYPVFVPKHSMASAFGGIENPLFFKPNARMLFGDAKASLQALVAEFKAS